MTRRTQIIYAVIAAVWFVAADRSTLAAEPQIAGTQVISSDATARFMALGIGKSVVIDFPTDIKDVLVGDKGVAAVVVQSKRRVYVIGAALGQTNVYFFGADGRQIDALDIAVVNTSQPAALENYPNPANVVIVYNGGRIQALSCTNILCLDTLKPGAELPPGTQSYNMIGGGTAIVGGK